MHDADYEKAPRNSHNRLLHLCTVVDMEIVLSWGRYQLTYFGVITRPPR
jgi:hypothetical protein